MIKLYPFSLQGSIADQYGHFFFSVLIPLIVLDHTTPRNESFELKLDVGGFARILSSLFLDREITIRPVAGAGITSFIGDNFELYISTLTRIRNTKNSKEIVLDSTEVFDDIVYKFVSLDTPVDMRRLKALQDKYVSFHSTKQARFKLSLKEIVERKKLRITFLYNRIKLARPIVLDFFARRAAIAKPLGRVARPIVLVSRPISYAFNASIFSAVGGQRRFIWNFDKLRKKLEAVFGAAIETLVLEDMDIMEQYAAFRGAKVAVGQHGAGLVNCFFMPQGSHIVEITPCYNDRNNFFKNMARFCGLEYSAVAQPGMTPAQAEKFFKKCKLPADTRESVARNLAAFYSGAVDMTLPWAVPNEVNMAANSGDVDIAAVVRSVKAAIESTQ